jgi:dTDP-4-amino-4,6-dideoxygalactose transaminase
VRYHHDLIGLNGRLDEIQALVLRTKLPHLEEWNTLRRQHAAQYNTLLNNTLVSIPVEHPENRHIYHLYVVRTPNRDSLQAHLKEQGIFTGIHYPIPCHLQQALAYLGYKPGDFPVTEAAVQQIISLPMFPEITDEDIEAITREVNDYLGNYILNT